MHRISGLSIGTKLTAISVLSIVLVVSILVTVLLGNSSVRDSYSFAMLEQDIVQNVLKVEAEVLKARMTMRSIRLAQSLPELDKVNDLAKTQEASNATFSTLIPKFKRAENQEHTKEIKQIFDQYISRAQNEIVPLKRRELSLDRKDFAGIVAVDEELQKLQREHLDPLANKVMADLDKVMHSTSELADVTANAASEQLSASSFKASGMSIVTIVLLIGAAVFGAFSIARPLRALVRPLGEIANGNFAISIPNLHRNDEVGLIARAAQTIAEKVGAAIGGIKISAAEVNSASAEISSSTTDLSQRTEEQAASLEQTSAAMEQIAATVKRNADNANQANRFAIETSSVAERGGAVVGDAVQAMARIEESSTRIVDIISVIDEIARQTNLLALNAAVEAARAGEAGRGFAVVASEVRSLAQRSSQAAKDINGLITNSDALIKDGVGLVNKAGSSLEEIVRSTKKVVSIVADIANASTEQASGIEQVNKALTQMDEVTQQNSALVEENAATAKALENQARSMDERVSAFRLQNQGGDGSAASDVAAAGSVSPAAARKPNGGQAIRRVAA